MKHQMNQQKHTLLVLFVVSCVLTLTACGTPAWKKPVPVDRVDFMQDAVTQTQDGLTVTVAVPSKEHTELLFGTSLYADRIQPVWVRVESASEHPYVLTRVGVDQNYYSPLEASFQRHSGSKEVKREMDLFFYDMGFKNPVLPGKTTEGFIFTNLDEGHKAVNIDLIGDQSLIAMSFVIHVPGMTTDVDQVSLDSIYDEWTNIETEDELISVLESMTCCTTNKDGSDNGDPLNIVMVGDKKDIFSALIRRGWHQTEVTHAASAWKTIKSFLFGTRYRYSPISSLYVFGRSQDLGLQKARDSIHLRNHMRLWRTPYNYQGKDIYLGQISRDVGVKFNKRTFTTHAIDPDIDDTRDGLAGDLAYSQALAEFGYVKGSQVSTFDDTYYNLTPDPYYSDGLRLVMFFEPRPTTLDKIKTLDWEQTRELKARYSN